jgi:hypothetical protein
MTCVISLSRTPARTHAHVYVQVATLTMRNELLEAGGGSGSDGGGGYEGVSDAQLRKALEEKDIHIQELRRIVEDEAGGDDAEHIINAQAATIAELRRRLRSALRDAIDADRETEQLYEDKERLEAMLVSAGR